MFQYNGAIVGSTCQFIKLESESYGEKEELVCNRDEECDCEIVVIKRVDLHVRVLRRHWYFEKVMFE